jgi:hypothetical protein
MNDWHRARAEISNLGCLPVMDPLTNTRTLSSSQSLTRTSHVHEEVNCAGIDRCTAWGDMGPEPVHDVRNSHKSYPRDTWSKVLACLRNDGLMVKGTVQKPVLKELPKSFHLM